MSPDVTFRWATIAQVSPIRIILDGDSAALALTPDTLIDPNLLYVGERVRVELSLRKAIIHGASYGGVTTPAGVICLTAAASSPSGWLLCQGQNLFRASYPALFAAIGTLYGAVNSESFNIPDTRGRVVVGVDNSQTEFNARGKTGGAKTHSLTPSEGPSHTHDIQTNTSGPTVGSNPSAGVSRASGLSYTSSWTTTGSGSGAAHNNLQPYISMQYMIKI